MRLPAALREMHAAPSKHPLRGGPGFAIFSGLVAGVGRGGPDWPVLRAMREMRCRLEQENRLFASEGAMGVCNVRSRIMLLASMMACAAYALPASAATNLLNNPGAEAGVAGSIVPGWNTTGTFEVVSYNAGGGFPLLTDPGSPNRESKFFAGGSSAPTSTALQTVLLGQFAGEIDAGSKGFTLSGWLGGFSSQNDHCDVSVTFYDNTGLTSLGQASIGGVRAAERGSNTGMLLRSVGGVVPVGTRQALVIITMTREAGTYNDGYADDLSFSLGAACPCDLNGDGFVEDTDFTIFVGAYNLLDCADPSMAPGCPADFDGDGLVDDADFVVFVQAYNELVCP